MDLDNRQYKAQRLEHFTGIGISENAFNLAIGLVLLWGFLVNACMAVFLTGPILQMNYLVILLLYFAGSIVGTLTVYRSDQPAVSFVGFIRESFRWVLLM
jgi:hypothetical protein